MDSRVRSKGAAERAPASAYRLRMRISLREMRDLSDRLGTEVAFEHSIGILRLTDDGYAIVVCDTHGVVLAWDGAYYSGQVSDETPILDQPFDTWDDARAVLFSRSNAALLREDGPLMFVLSPTYSPALEGAQVVNLHRDSGADEARAGHLRSGRVVGFVPIVDTEAFRGHLEGDIAEWVK